MRSFKEFFCATTVAMTMGSAASAQTSSVTLDVLPGEEAVNIVVDTSCAGADPVFAIQNAGADWPRLTQIQVVRVADEEVIIRRNMRMKSEQRATFRLPTGRLGEGAYGIRFLPSWYERDVQFDATMSCN